MKHGSQKRKTRFCDVPKEMIPILEKWLEESNPEEWYDKSKADKINARISKEILKGRENNGR